MRGGTKLAREIQLTDWSTAGNLSNRSSAVQIPRDICTRFGRYLSSSQLRIDHWSVVLVRDVTYAVYANYYPDQQRGEKKWRSLDVLYVEMLWIVL